MRGIPLNIHVPCISLVWIALCWYSLFVLSGETTSVALLRQVLCALYKDEGSPFGLYSLSFIGETTRRMRTPLIFMRYVYVRVSSLNFIDFLDVPELADKVERLKHVT